MRLFYSAVGCKMQMEHSSASVTEWIPQGGEEGGGAAAAGEGGGGEQSEHSRSAFPALFV